ncbi:DJ-1/PfpI family protein [Vagococcus sp. BWB3-3]|uniref:DJ-1/PfpI family protein n=1 Tax=Vagococcus allomyrinae TaxID=2794353 RepID=A0A940P5R7_9ENTE|nr:DJ-1/PfpI family protein [Vagococcus allomyrinae]MBP1042109.1 DJ-1/PfpI family protein [Vagococcus allomyrinae]
MKKVNVILFSEFELLDATGPIEIFSRLADYQVTCFSENGGLITSAQGVQLQTTPFLTIDPRGILLIPGGKGTRRLVDNDQYLSQLKQLSIEAEYVLTVCTGAALLAKTGLLNNQRATTNKLAFSWVKSVNQNVKWVEQARWVVSRNIYTSSGVSAGMDMVLGFIADRHDQQLAKQVAREIEYNWHEDPDVDPFAITE